MEPIDDPLDSLLSLEEQYYTEGYNLGVADGSRAGRIEGRIFGLEKGFEKFAEMGRLAGRFSIWSSRQLNSTEPTEHPSALKIPPIDGNDRLRKHIKRLGDLTDPDTLSNENSEDAVAEFDDRLKDAKAKATLISKIVGEDSTVTVASSSSKPGVGKGMHSADAAKAKRYGEMEDFTGIRGSNAKVHDDK